MQSASHSRQKSGSTAEIRSDTCFTVEVIPANSPVRTDSTREVRIRKAFAICSMLAGIGWLAMTIVPPVSKFFSDKENGIDPVFILTMIPFLSIPGFIFLWFGYRLFQKRTEESLRAIVGTATFLLITMVGLRTGEWMKPLFPNLPYEGCGMLLLALTTAIIYP